MLSALALLLSLVAPYSSHAQVTAPDPSTSMNPVIAGDHPDPTVIRVSGVYWTASTSGEWAPEFPLYRSTDLHHWKQVGSIFPQSPSWAKGSFWAPELVEDHGRVIAYYAARKRDGRLCVGAASAFQPFGPYIDHGPLVCQKDGTIDPSMARDEQGHPFLIWKEDGNSIHKPTTIWAQPLTEDLLHLRGKKSSLIVNDPSSWEGPVVEGPYVRHHGAYFYLFYAGNTCCGVSCNYAEGVARAPHLLGPWTKNPNNPIIRGNAEWRCPGHGTAVETPDGRDYFIYHAYPANGTVYVGRESVLDRIEWVSGWPVINSGRGPSGGEDANANPISYSDDFRAGTLAPGWIWPVGHRPHWRVSDGQLTLIADSDSYPAILARGLLGPQYTASVGLMSGLNASGGLAIIGDTHRFVGLLHNGSQLELWSLRNGKRTILWSTSVPETPLLWLRVDSEGPHRAAFSYSVDRVDWTHAGPALDVAGLLAWDQGLRIGLLAAGPRNTHSSFEQFRIRADVPNRRGFSCAVQ